jgi:predicted cupin superfamily sugar epimerase
MTPSQQIKKTADEFINELKLSLHPFGCGYFREIYREPMTTKIERSNGVLVERSLSTCIIAIFKGNQINPLHRTLATQIIHYYPGGNSNLLVHVIRKNGELKTYRMPEETFQLKISPETWFAFEVEDKHKNAFVISGHDVSPGFDLQDFELAEKEILSKKFPRLSDFISRFSVNFSKSLSGKKS